jgi:hypothetical protein
MEDVLSLEGPVLKINGELVLMIPLWAGVEELQECSRGISEVQGEFLKIVIPEWLAGMLRMLCVENAEGRFHITPSNPRPVH